MKRIYSSFNRVAAHHIKNLLEAEGVEAVVRNEILSSAMGELPPAECQTEVWILEKGDFDKANEILRAASFPTYRPPWECTSCGERCEGQFTQCWRCGAYRAP